MSEAGVKTPEQPIGAEKPSGPEPTLREQVSHAFNELKAKEAPVEKPAIGETPKPADTNRDEAGKFTAKPEAERKTLTLPGKPETPAAPVVAAKPPESWTPAAKAKFAAMDPDLQKEVLRREGEITKGLSNIDTDRTLGKKIRETAAPYLATIKAEGGDEGAAFGAFLNYAHIMRSGTPQQKMQALQSVAQQFNVPLGRQPQQAAPNQAFESVMQRIDRLERERQADLQQRQAHENAQVLSEIDAFAQEPGHEHYEAVKTKMGSLLLNGEATDLQDAYDQAIWANREIRSTLTQAQMAEAEQKRLSQTQANTGAAKWASGSVIGAPGGSKPNGAIVERSLGDEIRANMKASLGRV